MYKKLCSFFALVLVCLCFVGCGELSFEDTPYGTSDKTAAEIVSFYSEAQVGNLQLQAKYEGTVTEVYGTTTKVNKMKYILGKYGNFNYCSIENTESINGIVTKTTTDIYYKDYRYTTIEDVAAETTTKTKKFMSTNNTNRDTVYELFPVLYVDSIENTGYKMYDNEKYYKLTLTKKSVNDEFTDPVITVPTGYYINSFGYEFGVNKAGYLAYIVNEYSLIDENYLENPNPVLTHTSIIKLVPPYGSTMYMPEPPSESDTSYEEI